MCAFVLNLTLPVVAGKAVVEQASASEMEDMKSDIVDSEATNLSAETFSKSVDVSSWSDVSEVPKKVLVSTGCGTSLVSTDCGTSSAQTHVVESGRENSGNENQKSGSIQSTEKKLVSTSTGTSPPPQSISTQVSNPSKSLIQPLILSLLLTLSNSLSF